MQMTDNKTASTIRIGLLWMRKPKVWDVGSDGYMPLSCRCSREKHFAL